jgi:hypothetical protein
LKLHNKNIHVTSLILFLFIFMLSSFQHRVQDKGKAFSVGSCVLNDRTGRYYMFSSLVHNLCTILRINRQQGASVMVFDELLQAYQTILNKLSHFTTQNAG